MKSQLLCFFFFFLCFTGTGLVHLNRAALKIEEVRKVKKEKDNLIVKKHMEYENL